MSRAWPIAVVSAAAALLGGCAADRPSQRQLYGEGSRVFVSAGCGGCHTVASLHTRGQVGPDFDKSERLNRDEIRTQLDYGGGGMPPFRDRLTPRQRDSVIEFVFQTLHHHP